MPTVVEHCTSLTDKGVDLSRTFEFGLNRMRQGFELISFNLLRSENRRGACEETFFDFIFFVNIDLIVEDDMGGFLAFTNLCANGRPLIEGAPDPRAETL
jgi:hypothetical protein